MFYLTSGSNTVFWLITVAAMSMLARNYGQRIPPFGNDFKLMNRVLIRVASSSLW